MATPWRSSSIPVIFKRETDKKNNQNSQEAHGNWMGCRNSENHAVGLPFFFLFFVARTGKVVRVDRRRVELNTGKSWKKTC